MIVGGGEGRDSVVAPTPRMWVGKVGPWSPRSQIGKKAKGSPRGNPTESNKLPTRKLFLLGVIPKGEEGRVTAVADANSSKKESGGADKRKGREKKNV